MDTDAQIAANKSQITANQSQISSAQSKIAANNSKITRLKTARDTLRTIKSNVKDHKKSDKKIVRDVYEWKGEHYNTFKNYTGQGILDEDDDFIDSLDEAADEIQQKITALENENYYEEGVIGRLKAAINTLVGEINILTQ